MRSSALQHRIILAMAMSSFEFDGFITIQKVHGMALSEMSLPLEKLTAHANSYASASGLQIEKRNDEGSSVYECAPISLLPNAFPKEVFRRAQSLALDRKSTRLNSSHQCLSRMPSSA